MLQITDATCGTVGIEFLVNGILRCKRDVEAIAGRAAIDAQCFRVNFHLIYIIAFDGLAQRHAVDTAYGRVEQTTPGQFAQDVQYASRAVHILYVVLLRVGRHLAEAGHAARQHVDVVHPKIHLSLVGNGQQMEHRVGGASHGDIQRHGIEESLAGGNVARQHAVISLFIVFIGVAHDECRSVPEEAAAVDVGGQHGAVAGKGQSDGLVEAVHGIGGKHARTTAASRAGMLLDGRHLGIAYRRVGRLHHGVNQVQMLPVPFTGLHRAAAHEHRGDVQAHGGHQHARSNLVAVADADHGVRLVCIDHILHAVGNEVARRQGIEHAVVPHGYAVVNGYRIEFGGKAAQTFYFGLHHLAHLMQMGMTRNKLGKRVDNGNDGLPHLLALHSVGHPECSGSGHTASLCADGTT